MLLFEGNSKHPHTFYVVCVRTHSHRWKWEEQVENIWRKIIKIYSKSIQEK